MAELTPMMQQYVKLKEANPGALLFFRLGDFYEMFGEDAKTASRELDLTLTTRDRGKDKADQTPMCGVPYHSCEGYIARLIAKGYKVAICEQMEDPATAKGLVERDIIRVVTPGTVTDSSMLEDGRSNYISAVFLSDNGTGVCFVDVSTGRTMATAFSGAESVGHLINELGRFSPAEVVLGGAAADHPALNEFLRDRLHCHRERGKDAAFDLAAAERTVRRQFGEEALKALPQSIPAVTMALGGLLSYLYETQKTDLSYINDLDYYEQGEFMEPSVGAGQNENAHGIPVPARLSGASPAFPHRHRKAPARCGRLGGRYYGPRRADPDPDRHRGHRAPYRPHCIRHRRRAGYGLAAQRY